jgi:two-component system, LytTR family, sensor kinase
MAANGTVAKSPMLHSVTMANGWAVWPVILSSGSGALNKRLRTALGIFAVWTVIATLAGLGRIVYRVRHGNSPNWPEFFAATYADWYSCAIFTPLIFWMSRRFPINKARLVPHLVLHLVATVAFIAMKLAIYLPIAERMGWTEPGVTFGDQMLRSAFALTLAYWIVLAAEHGLKYYRNQVRLEASLSEVRLNALKAQIHPHFLFNALNAVATLMHRDVAAADRMVLELGELLRELMQSDGKQETTVADEVRLTQRYLHIMSIRFGNRLNFDMKIEPETSDALVPHLMLQPLVENAVRHGLERSPDALRLHVSTKRRGAVLDITVRDDGPGFPSIPPRLGLGLQNTRDRLLQLYGGAANLKLENAAQGGAQVSVSLPYRTADGDA